MPSPTVLFTGIQKYVMSFLHKRKLSYVHFWLEFDWNSANVFTGLRSYFSCCMTSNTLHISNTLYISAMLNVITKIFHSICYLKFHLLIYSSFLTLLIWNYISNIFFVSFWIQVVKLMLAAYDIKISTIICWVRK